MVTRTVAALRAVGRRLATGEGTHERPPLIDVLSAVGLSLPPIVQLATGAYPADTTDPRVLALVWLLLVAIFVPLAWRRVTPVLTMTITGIATGVGGLFGLVPDAALTGVLVALYSVSAYGTKEDGRVSLFVAIGFIAASAGRELTLGLAAIPNVALTLFVFVGAWGLGDRTRARRHLLDQATVRAEEAERSRELAAQLAVADERARIARELHDVVAHAVSVMVVQAGAARRVAERDPGQAADALAAIEAAGRDALTELRRLVQVLRAEDAADELAPQPTLDDVDALVTRVREVGVPVTFEMTGDRQPLPSSAQVSVYRIVQEALTNVLKHAGTVARVAVALHFGAGQLTVRVTDDGRGAAVPPAAGAGLVGMRERAALLGGSLAAGPAAGGGFEVVVTLPLERLGVMDGVGRSSA